MRLLFALLLLPTFLFAQSYPEYQSTTVNDFAGLLSDEAKTRVHDELSKLREDTGVEMTLVTLERQSEFAPEATVEEFATGLFNAWGIGNKDINDGVLVLILRQDRAMRIESGKSYDSDWNRTAARVIDRSFLPAFAEDRYEAGIEAGVSDVIDSIVYPHRGGERPKDGEGWSWLTLAIPGLGFLAYFFRDQFVRLRRCPNCGRRRLSRDREVLRKASKTLDGDGEIRTRCRNCDYHDIRPYTIPHSSSSSSFGGGSSGGGGATGRW